MLQLLPAEVTDCKDVAPLLLRMSNKISRLGSVTYFLRVVGTNMLKHGLDIIALFSKSGELLLNGSIYESGVAFGDAMEMATQE